MGTVAVFGASGFTGRLVVRACLDQGIVPVAIGRDRQRVGDALAAIAASEEVEHIDVRVADAEDAGSLRQAFDGVDLVVATVGPFARLGRPALDAAISTGTHYVDIAGEQEFLRWVYRERDVAVRDAGIVAVPAAGFDYLPGDLLASIATGAVTWPSEVHVAYTLPPRGGRAGAASGGTRRTIASMLGRPGVALEDGALVADGPGEARRLAWFPRPVGPRHAAGIPGGEPISVPRHVPGIRTVRTYLAVPGWQAEALQLAAGAARWRPARRAMSRLLERGEGGPSRARRQATAWGCVAEASGDDGVARAWAYGHDPYGLTATAVVTVAEAVLQGDPAPGVVPPAALASAPDLLDTLGARCELRWSVARPTAREGGGAR